MTTTSVIIFALSMSSGLGNRWYQRQTHCSQIRVRWAKFKNANIIWILWYQSKQPSRLWLSNFRAYYDLQIIGREGSQIVIVHLWLLPNNLVLYYVASSTSRKGILGKSSRCACWSSIIKVAHLLAVVVVLPFDLAAPTRPNPVVVCLSNSSIMGSQVARANQIITSIAAATSV